MATEHPQEDPSFEEEFSNWAKTVLSLRNARDGSINYIKSIMEAFVEEQLRMHGSDEEDHFQKLLTKVAVNGEVNEKKKQLTPKDRFVLTDNSCKTCDQVFENQLKTFEEKRWSGKNMVCHKTEEPEEQIDRSSYWWVLAKMYMLKSNVTDAKDPQEVEPSAIFKLLSNCNLFDKVKGYGKELIELRNKLVHSADNRLKEKEMKESFKLIKEFLMQVADDKTEVIKEVEELEQTTLKLIEKNGQLSERAKEALQLQTISLNSDFKVPAGIQSSDIPSFRASNLVIQLKEMESREKESQYEIQIQKMRTELELKEMESSEKESQYRIQIQELRTELEELKDLEEKRIKKARENQQRLEQLDRKIEANERKFADVENESNGCTVS